MIGEKEFIESISKLISDFEKQNDNFPIGVELEFEDSRRLEWDGGEFVHQKTEEELDAEFHKAYRKANPIPPIRPIEL